MADQVPPDAPSDTMDKGRVEAFSDGVFAVAITLLVLDVHVDAGAVGRDGLWAALGHEWVHYLSYAVSFMTIGVMWVNHHTLLAKLGRVDHGLLYRNLALLAIISFVPFPTGILAEYVHESGASDQRAAAALYGIVMVGLSACYTLLWSHLSQRPHLRDASVGDDEVRTWLHRCRNAIGIYAIATLVSFIVPIAAVFVYALVVTAFVFARSPRTAPAIDPLPPG